MKWELRDLFGHCNSNHTEINERWVPARPINYTCESLRERVSNAWKVVRGEADIVIWPCGQ